MPGKLFRNPGILGKMAFSFTLLVAVALLVSFLISWYNTREAVIDRASEQLLYLRDSKKKQLEQFFREREAEIVFIAGILKEQQHDVPGKGTNKETELLKPFDTSGITARYIEYCKVYKSIVLIRKSDSARTCLFTRRGSASACPEGFDYPLMQAALQSGRVFHSDLEPTGEGGEPSYRILFYAPVTLDPEPCAAVFEMPAERFFSSVLESKAGEGFESSVETYLVGSDLKMRSPSKFVPHSVMRTDVGRDAVSEQSQMEARVITDYRNKKVLSTSAPFLSGGNTWYLISEIDYDEVLRPAASIIDRYILFSLSILLGVIVLTYFIARGITRPLARLTRATARIGQGHFDVSLDTQKKDETGTLAKALTAMAVKIRDDRKEMKEREERLQHFYDATIDGIILHDNGSPVLVNTAMTSLTGYTQEELMGRDVGHIYRIRGMDLTTVLKKTYSFESVVRRKDGIQVPVEIQETSVEYGGKMIRASVIRNITRRKEVEEALRVERQNRVSAVFDGQEMERRRLSRELHDGLGQYLIAVKLHLESILVPGKPVSALKVTELRKMLDNIIDEVRQISNDLMPPVLVEFGLGTAIRNLVRNLTENAGIRLVMRVDLPETLNDKLKTYTFRIVQEAMNNVVKHAQASEVTLSLLSDEEFLYLKVEDNGKGFIFEWQNAGKGNGLHNIRARVLLLGGTFNVRTAIGAGTALDVKLPINHDV